ncbi:MAG: universal stress protein [Actinomycetota bacterium]
MTTNLDPSPDPAAGIPPTGGEPVGTVVGIDGSPGAAHALAWAVRRAARFGPIRPVFAWEYPVLAFAGPMQPGPPLSSYEHFEDAARRLAAESVAEVPAGASAPVSVVNGPPAATLVELAASAGLLVVGTRGRSAPADILLGSVSGRVVRTASVPVVVVPESVLVEDTHRRVVVGVDGSANSIAALAWALRHAPTDSVVEAVYVWSHLVSVTPVPPYVVPTETSKEAAGKVLARAVDAAHRTSGVDRRVEATLDYGDDPRNLLVDHSVDADLLVLGARGRGGVSHLVLGSVTTSLLHRPQVTTVVVPAVADGEDDG